MGHSVKEQFDAIAKQYDRQRRQLIPCFDDFYGVAAMLAFVQNFSISGIRVLDLGAGTGLFSAFVKHKYPDAEFTLIDLSENMLQTARERFGPTSNIEYIVADYTNYDFSKTYDLVISSLSIHHLTHPGKRKLFRTVYYLLSDGGVFVNADQAMGNTTYVDTYYKQQWEAAIQLSGLSNESIAAAKERRKLDINATVNEQIVWLQEAGFADADCMYKYMDFAVFFARKTSLKQP
ncbi:class I SAM-dependent methyltransferase [Paenibacillus radicis (ex Xue et al. 2023)]|uniref:Class I SAM-dependent methyltransferase n=1 Tax=Paenibacillus radicis (ex Xue et al. 2023) TaxID=2972489 RepID=A0ABT1YKU7_9BACL|nr:class I SAM-dependent methyltransferase [Paenibacillus radicis (ex Xue et al. 2023)]MCR8633817.1 class I SAM-dependent methyltransferase [Paenibacillus radicis (ex Xue et al. 2023)]